jgi:hypothetical protein
VIDRDEREVKTAALSRARGSARESASGVDDVGVVAEVHPRRAHRVDALQ